MDELIEQPQRSPEEEQRRMQEELEAMRQETRIPFSREDLQNAVYLRTTDFQAYLIEYINTSSLYESAKRALRSVTMNYTSSNAFLSNLEKGGLKSFSNTDEQLGARLSLEIDLLFATNSFMPSDLKSPDMVNIIAALRSHYKFTLSRAKGTERERVLQIKIASETTLKRIDQVIPSVQQPQPQKKSFLSFLG